MLRRSDERVSCISGWPTPTAFHHPAHGLRGTSYPGTSVVRAANSERAASSGVRPRSLQLLQSGAILTLLFPG